MTASVQLAEVLRSRLVESVHLGSIAVASADGTLGAWAGDPSRRSFARSCTKPLQAAVTLSLVGDEDLSDAEIALMCGSHNGEPAHVETAASILRRAGLGFEALRCPPAWPFRPEDAAVAASKDARYHNCSGKHAGLLLACVRQGWDVASYDAPTHPLQERIQDGVRAATGEEPAVGVDGCGIPVHAVSLRGVATMYARLSDPRSLGGLAPFVTRALRSMKAEPFQVEGTDCFDTEAGRMLPNVVTKRGAEGLLAAAVIDRGIGVVVEIDDGSFRPAPPALLLALRQLGVIADSDLMALGRWSSPEVLGGGRAVGAIVAGFFLEGPLVSSGRIEP